VTKFHAKVETVEQFPHLLRQAFREATTGTPRPVHLDVAGLTGDALTALPIAQAVVADACHTQYPAFRPQPDPQALAAAAEAIARAERPVLVADRGAVVAQAGEALLQLASRLQCPLAVTLDAKSIVPEDHPLFRGTVGLYGRSSTNRMMAEADLVIYAGSNTSDHTTANWTLPRPGTPIANVAAVSGNCVSTATSASLFASQPMLPPRPVKIPTSRRSALNSVTVGAGAIAGRGAAPGAADWAGAWADRVPRASRPADANNEERTRKSRRFIPSFNHEPSPMNTPKNR
jgi:hypothetical protein